MKLYKFEAKWCQPCKTMTQMLQGFDLMPITVVDIDDESATDLVLEYGVRGVPTMILTKDDEVVFKKTGLITVEELKNEINSRMDE